MKRINLITALLSLALLSPAGHAGDTAAGKSAFSAKGCAACHGKTGKQPIAPNYPVIGGKPADFLAAELNKFRAGERQDPTMSAMAGMLNDADVANIAAFLASQ